MVAMLVAMYIVGPFLLLRHRGRRVRCAQDARVQSAPVDNRLGPSRASGPPVKLITTRRSSCRLPTLDFQLQLSFGFQGSYFLITPSFFCPTYINLPPLADGSILHPWTPLVLIHTLFLAQNYYSASRHTRILQTRSRAFFFSVVITVVTINTSITFSQSVNQLVFFCIKSSCSCFFFSVLMTIRQSKPYTATFFILQYGVLHFFFSQYPSFCSTFWSSSYSLALGKRNGDDSHMIHVPRDKASQLDIIIIPKGYPGRLYHPRSFFLVCPDTTRRGH